MSRRSQKRPYGSPHPELDVSRVFGGPHSRIEPGPNGEDYHVAVPRLSVKSYVCPGCGSHIAPGRHHVVAWPTDGLFGPEAAAEERRHWHAVCWERFGRTGA